MNTESIKTQTYFALVTGDAAHGTTLYAPFISREEAIENNSNLSGYELLIAPIQINNFKDITESMASTLQANDPFHTNKNLYTVAIGNPFKRMNLFGIFDYEENANTFINLSRSNINKQDVCFIVPLNNLNVKKSKERIAKLKRKYTQVYILSKYEKIEDISNVNNVPFDTIGLFLEESEASIRIMELYADGEKYYKHVVEIPEDNNIDLLNLVKLQKIICFSVKDSDGKWRLIGVFTDTNQILKYLNYPGQVKAINIYNELFY